MHISQSVQAGFDRFFEFLPNLIGFLVLLLIGYVVAKVVATVVRRALDGLNLDRHLHDSDAHRYIENIVPGASPSRAISRLVFWLIVVFFLTSAVGALQIAAVTTFMTSVLNYLPNVIVAILIFVVAAAVAGAAATGVTKTMGDTPTGKIVATVVPALVMVIAMFMVLQQLRIAQQIVEIAFAATMGAIALGLALAFGLGGRGVAERLLEDAYAKGRDQREQVKADLQTGKERARQAAGEVDRSTGTSTFAPGSTQTPTRPVDLRDDRATPDVDPTHRPSY